MVYHSEGGKIHKSCKIKKWPDRCRRQTLPIEPLTPYPADPISFAAALCSGTDPVHIYSTIKLIFNKNSLPCKGKHNQKLKNKHLYSWHSSILLSSRPYS